MKSNRLIAEAMVRRGHDVTILYPTRSECGEFALGYRFRRFREGLVDGLLNGARPRVHHLERSVARLVAVDGAVVTARDVPDADVCIATWWRTREWIEGWPEAKGLRCYFVRGYEIHGGEPERVRATYRFPGVKFVISRWLQRVMAEEFGDRDAVLVPNGVDRGLFHGGERSRSRIPLVGFMYGPQAIKGAETAFEAIRMIRERMPQVRVLSFGAHPLERRHSPPRDLEYHLRPAQRVIPELYRRVDCWVVPSTTEGFGMPGIEAAACRCPLVVTRCGGPEDYVEDGRNGFLVSVGDARAMADRVLDVLRAPEEQWGAMSEASYEISLRFDWDRSAIILEAALQRSLSGRGGEGE